MPLPKQLKSELARMLQEEELDLYVLTMHYRNDGDLNYFPEADRRRIKSILDILIQDTKRHAELLKKIAALKEY
ncbi:MAG TPA: hypothetical protein VJA00_00365 [Candidatus Omnitrophota bacterium]|nr:hypothetical protein [Candidatus Omnitrophota bacterium]